jgi:tetratricopeptide (TPR) repeat protein
MVGAAAGFLFSSYGEENTGPLGKVRDWLVGGLTTLTIVKARPIADSIKRLLAVFAAGAGPTEFAFTVGAATFYAGLGFFFMYFQRELILNLSLAESRAERGRLEGTQQAGQVLQRFLVRLPASVLTGVDYIDDVPDLNEKEVKELRDLLYQPEVDKFLEQSDDAMKKGAVDWDIASRAAYIHYYRTYFERDNQIAKKSALEWIIRALNMNPLHTDLTMKYAEILGANEDYEAAVGVLERLILRPEAPVLVKQWLGYYLRFMPDRADDAIRYSEEYHRLFSDEADTFFNIGYAYGRKYCSELRTSGKVEDAQSVNRLKAIENLRAGLREHPTMTENVRKWSEAGKPLECLKDDKEFQALIKPQAAAASG